MEDWVKMINSIAGFRAKELSIYNFNEWLSPHLNPLKNLMMVNQPHVFRFTRAGIITKQFISDQQFSSWRGRSEINGALFEPFEIVTVVPEGSPKIVEPRPFGIFSFFLRISFNFFHKRV